MRWPPSGALLGLALLSCPSVHGLGLPALDPRAALLASEAAIGSTPPDFTLLDRRERPVRLSAYRGKPLLVSFIYTGCFTYCPAQTRHLHAAVEGLDRLLGPDRFNVVSIGFNQPFDTPQAMRAFAAQHRIGYPNWEFLSPHGRIVEALTRAYGFAYVETPAGFEHTVDVTVVDAEGRIRAQIYGDRVSAEALGEPLRQLILATPAVVDGRLSIEQLLERVRVLCTIYDPDSGEYRYDWKLLLEILGGAGFFISVGVYLWRDRRTHAPLRAERHAVH